MLRNSLFLLLFLSCANEMLKKSPDLSKNERFYYLDQDMIGQIFARDCTNKVKGRDCEKKPVFDLTKEWQYFSNGFILVPYKMVFPVPQGN